jgi:predicted Zn-ribbon and HTH transcriptional regulator
MEPGEILRILKEHDAQAAEALDVSVEKLYERRREEHAPERCRKCGYLLVPRLRQGRIVTFCIMCDED